MKGLGRDRVATHLLPLAAPCPWPHAEAHIDMWHLLAAAINAAVYPLLLLIMDHARHYLENSLLCSCDLCRRRPAVPTLRPE
jgi:hypothetical protein